MIVVRLEPLVSGRCNLCEEFVTAEPGALVDVPGRAAGVTLMKMVCLTCVTELGCAYAGSAVVRPTIPPHQKALLTKPPPPPELRRSGGGK